MALTSDAMYNTRTTGASFMSAASMYYPYMPHCRNETQLNTVFENVGVTESPMLDCYSYNTAMETDDDGCDYSTASNYLNNESMIIEASLQNRLQGNDSLQRCQQQIGEGTGALGRRNRKRCNSDHGSACPLKRFRQGGGKDHAHSGMANSKDYGLATVSREPEPLRVDIVINNMQQSVITNRSCCWPAGEHDSSNLVCKQVWSNRKHVSIEDNAEYEKILFETHGCSIYQFHRSQLVDNDCGEAEF